MTEQTSPHREPFDDGVERGRRLLEALRRYQAADAAMRRRTRAAMAMGENEVRAMRFLLRESDEGRVLIPSDVARCLGISTPSVTALLDRLEASGRIERTPHPSDRRKVRIAPTSRAAEEVHRMVSEAQELLTAATRAVSAEQEDAIVGFLERAAAGADAVAVDPAPPGA